MLAVALAGFVKAGGSIAVNTAEEAGVVHPDVPTHHAAARLTLTRVLPTADLNAEHLTNEVVIHALTFRHTVRLQIDHLGAALDCHPVASGGFGNLADELPEPLFPLVEVNTLFA